MAGAIACGQTKQIKNIAQTEDAKTLYATSVKRNFQERHRAIVCFKKRTRHTNKQAIKQINKRTDEETTKTTKKQQRQTSRVACFFGPMQWLEPLRVVKRNNSKDNKQAITRTNTKS